MLENTRKEGLNCIDHKLKLFALAYAIAHQMLKASDNEQVFDNNRYNVHLKFKVVDQMISLSFLVKHKVINKQSSTKRELGE